MTYLIVAIGAFCIGVIAVFAAVEGKWQAARQEREALDRDQARLQEDQERCRQMQSMLTQDTQALRAKVIERTELERENTALKRDLRNIDTTVRKLEMDRRLQGESLRAIDAKCRELGDQYLGDVEKWVTQAINANNYTSCKQRLLKAIEWCRSIGVEVSMTRETELLEALKADYERAVRAALEREEQARIKAQIREEQKREKEIQRELEQLERERAAIQAALEKALAESRDAHSEEVERLRARLAEAEARNQRAISQAQLTRSGHIYVISNIGSFGEQVFKIGMTRRMEPHDRVRELGDASVPFPFDVHMMISCDDAPTLESTLHKELFRHRVNKINPRKEFFRVELESIRSIVERCHGHVDYVVDPEALQYRQSLEMPEDDQQFIEDAFAQAKQGLGIADEDDE